MPEERQERGGIVAAIDSTDWTRYAGQGSAVRRRGERRRRGRQAGAVLGTTAAVVGALFAVNGLGAGAVTRQGAAPASIAVPSSSRSASGAATSAAPGTPTAAPPTSGSSSDYPTFPAQLPTTPLLIADPGKVLESGVMGAGSIAGHSWQISYRVIPSGSAANSEPEVTMTDLTLDGKTISTGGSGTDLNGFGYAALDQFYQNSGIKNPMVIASGAPSPNATSVDLRWKNGTVVPVPIWTVKGKRFTAFGWDPANPPEALEQVSASGVQQIKITYDTMTTWSADSSQPSKFAVTPQPPDATTPTGSPNLSKAPKVTPISSGILGAGTVAGHTWQVAYEVIPSGSAANASPLAMCTDTTVDGITTGGGCDSPPVRGYAGYGFSSDPHDLVPLPLAYGAAPKGTTAVGLEWPDGTKNTTVTHDIEGWPVAALGFDPANPPAYLLEFGSYGEYRIPFTIRSHSTWTFNW